MRDTNERCGDRLNGRESDRKGRGSARLPRAALSLVRSAHPGPVRKAELNPAAKAVGRQVSAHYLERNYVVVHQEHSSNKKQAD